MTPDEMPSDPWDVLAEAAVLGECMHAGKVEQAVQDLIGPGDFYRPANQMVAEVCWDFTARDVMLTPPAIIADLHRRKARVEPSYVLELLSQAVPMAAYNARRIRECAHRRDVILVATRALQQARDPGTDVYDVAAALAVQATAASEPPENAEQITATGISEFLSGPTEYDWLIPDLIERGDRLILTGSEGSGKSVLTRQIGVAVACGVHPFTGERMEPQRVLLADMENGDRHLRRLLQAAGRHARDIGRWEQMRDNLHVESRPGGIDLLGPADQAWLGKICESAAPDLIVIGPLYLMHAGDTNSEEPARLMTRTLDALRMRHGAALVMETHAGHGSGIGKRDLRPVGSSLFRRWPEFGYGLQQPKEVAERGGVMDLMSWRGPRDQRHWPAALRRGEAGEWPWVDNKIAPPSSRTTYVPEDH